MNELQEKISEKRKRVKGVARILAVICRVVSLCMIVIAAGMTGEAVLLFQGMLDESDASYNGLFAISGMIFPLFSMIPFEGLGQKEILTVMLGGSGLLMLFAAWLIALFARMFRTMAQDNFVFKHKDIIRIRVLALCCVAAGVCQPLFLLAAMQLVFLSFTFDYGREVEREADRTIAVQEEVILSLAEIMDGKSGETGQHVKRVSEYSRILAEGLRLPRQQIENIRIASTLHDIGKLMVPNGILEKPGKLTEEEFAIVKQHVNYGEKMLHNASGEVMQIAAKIAREHHERWDGTGYPGKQGEEICLEARIVALADVFDALSSRRSYKEAWDLPRIYEEILSQSGRQFDPAVVEVFREKWEEFQKIGKQYAEAVESREINGNVIA